MQPKRIAPSDLRATAQQLLRTGKMPKLDDLLGVVSKIREKYAPQIKSARSKGATAVNDVMQPLVDENTPAPDEFAAGGESSPIPPTGDLTPPGQVAPIKSLFLGKRTGVATPPAGRGLAASLVPQGSATHGSNMPKI
jgi:hypothetical protein